MSYVPAYGAGIVAHFHAPDAVLVEYDLSEHTALLDAAVASLSGPGVDWTLRPTFPSPFVSGTTAHMWYQRFSAHSIDYVTTIHNQLSRLSIFALNLATVQYSIIKLFQTLPR